MTQDTQVSAGFTETNVKLKKVRDFTTGGANDLNAYTGTVKTSMVAIANELLGIAQTATGVISDTADATVTDKAYSAMQVHALLAANKQQTKDELVDGADNSFDTFLEAYNAVMANDGDIAAALGDIAANTTLINAAQGVADTALANAATAQDAAVAAQGTADTATTDIAALTAAVGATDTDYAALVSAGL